MHTRHHLGLTGRLFLGATMAASVIGGAASSAVNYVANTFGYQGKVVAENVAHGDIIRVYDYDFFTGGATNSKLLDNYNDFTNRGNVPSDRNHHQGYSFKEVTERVCGNSSNNNPPFSTQKIMGKYVDMSFGQKPTGMIDTHDLTGDGIGDYDDVTGNFYIDVTDNHYVAGTFFGMKMGDAYGAGKVVGGIKLNDVFDITQLPAWPDVSTSKVYLPQIDLIPEPATATLLVLGGAGVALKRRKRRNST